MLACKFIDIVRNMAVSPFIKVFNESKKKYSIFSTTKQLTYR